jgi:hypothetical protein
MRYAEAVGSWVVYQMPVKGQPGGMNAVCGQREWEAMEAARPGYYTLVRAGIANEGEAERLARGTSGDRPTREARRSPFGGDPKAEPPGPASSAPGT